MLKTKLAVGLAASALLASTALAQTQAPTAPAGQGQVMTQMPQDLMRGSRLMGIDVYGADNQKIGDIDEVLVDRQGKIHGLVVGVGGFLGLGQKDVAIPFDQVQWMSNQEVQAMSNQGGTAGGTATNTAGGVTAPNAAGTTAAGQPATTGSTAGGTMGTAGGRHGSVGRRRHHRRRGQHHRGRQHRRQRNDAMPARAMVRMTKADLQNAPEFRYSSDANRANTTTGGTGTTGGATTTTGGTTTAPAGAARPAPAPQ
jgi:sporulation protein YlmC with PRC-barrel domain